MLKDVWYESSHYANESRLWSFYIDPTNRSSGVGCPIVYFEYQSLYGEVQVNVGVNRYPTQTDYDYIHYPFSKENLYDSVNKIPSFQNSEVICRYICPHTYSYQFGWYYLLSYAGAPAVPFNTYKLRWGTMGMIHPLPFCFTSLSQQRILESDVCTTTPLPVGAPLPTVNDSWYFH
jgi:hypothetical protein